MTHLCSFGVVVRIKLVSAKKVCANYITRTLQWLFLSLHFQKRMKKAPGLQLTQTSNRNLVNIKIASSMLTSHDCR